MQLKPCPSGDSRRRLATKNPSLSCYRSKLPSNCIEQLLCGAGALARVYLKSSVGSIIPSDGADTDRARVEGPAVHNSGGAAIPLRRPLALPRVLSTDLEHKTMEPVKAAYGLQEHERTLSRHYLHSMRPAKLNCFCTD